MVERLVANENVEGSTPFARSIMKKIIYDLGSNNGDNIPYYLMRSDSVVAIEANSKLCKDVKERFKNEILDGRLFVENCIVVADNNKLKSNREFYIQKDAHVLSQYPRPSEEILKYFKKTKVKAKNLISLIKKYGEPYYVKVDVENYDYEIISSLFENKIFPKYLSVECYNKKIYEKIMNNAFYNAYKLVCGSNVNKQYGKRSYLNKQEKVSYSFPIHSAGPFGNDIDGKWLTKKNFNFLYSLKNTKWIDIHCSRIDVPDRYYLPLYLIFFFKKKFFKKFLILSIFVLIFFIIYY